MPVDPFISSAPSYLLRAYCMPSSVLGLGRQTSVCSRKLPSRCEETDKVSTGGACAAIGSRGWIQTALLFSSLAELPSEDQLGY